MAKKIYLIVLLLITGSAFAQSSNYPYLKFRKPTTSGGSGWRFQSVSNGVDAIVKVVSSKNASLEQIDDSTNYPYAWNPFIKIKNSPARSNDSSYIEFNIAFVKSGTNTAHTLSKMAFGIVDLDGGVNGLNVYREMVKTSQPATSKGLLGTLISSIADLNWLTNVSGIVTYSNMDTSNFLAMSQVNYTNVSNFNIKVGVIGRIPGNTVREFSFYPKSFSALTLALPVELVDMKAVNNDNSNIVSWATSMENNSNHFEIYRSNDGENFEMIGQLAAQGNSNIMNHYSYIDRTATGNNYYKIKVVDNNGESFWSGTVFVKGSTVPSMVSSLYPNPATNTLNINLDNTTGSDFNLEVVDVFGKVMQSYNSSDIMGNSLTVDVAILNKGIYFVKVTDADGNATSTRFIKN